MTLEVVTLRLPRALLTDAQKLATARGVSIGEMVRQYLHHETTKLPETNEAAAVRVTTPIFDAAKDWSNLQATLAEAGFTLKPQGTGLALYDAKRDKYICNTAKAGFKYRKLVKRFRAKMPGHRQGDKWLSQETVPRFEVLE